MPDDVRVKSMAVSSKFGDLTNRGTMFGDDFVSYTVEYGHEGWTLEEAREIRRRLGIEVAHGALEHALVHNHISKAGYREVRQRIAEFQEKIEELEKTRDNEEGE